MHEPNSNNEISVENIEEVDNESCTGQDNDHIVDLNLEPISKTLVHGYGETHLFDDLANKIFKIAPFENYWPLGIFQDRYEESMGKIWR